MQRIKSLNGYTIYMVTERDAKRDARKTAGEYEIYFSSDIRDYGLTFSYAEFDGIGTLETALELCGGNYAIAREIAESESTAASYERIEEIEKQLDAGKDADEITESDESDETESETKSHGKRYTYSLIFNNDDDAKSILDDLRKLFPRRPVISNTYYDNTHKRVIRVNLSTDDAGALLDIENDKFTDTNHFIGSKVIQFVNETFETYLDGVKWFDGELIINSLDSEFSFVWDSDYTFTDDAKREYSAILNSKDFTISENVIELDAKCSERMAYKFLALCAGYVSNDYYEKCIVKKGGF